MTPHSLPTPTWQRAFAHQTFHVLHHRPGFQRPFSTEADAGGVGKQKVMHEANLFLRRSHQRVPWSKVLKDIILNQIQGRGGKKTKNHILTTEKAQAAPKPGISELSPNMLFMNDHCSVTISFQQAPGVFSWSKLAQAWVVYSRDLILEKQTNSFVKSIMLNVWISVFL